MSGVSPLACSLLQATMWFTELIRWAMSNGLEALQQKHRSLLPIELPQCDHRKCRTEGH